jgi:two-component system cell cycle sensor histidine kinase/response regulator CckA
MTTRRDVILAAPALAVAATVPGLAAAIPTAPRPPRILLVEDEDAVRGVAAKLLRARGYDVIEAANGREALRVVVGLHGLNMMICDTVLPDMGAVEMLRIARPWMGPIPVMFISNYAEGDFPSIPEGVTFVPKPIDIKTISAGVRDAIGKA